MLYQHVQWTMLLMVFETCFIFAPIPAVYWPTFTYPKLPSFVGKIDIYLAYHGARHGDTFAFSWGEMPQDSLIWCYYDACSSDIHLLTYYTWIWFFWGDFFTFYHGIYQHFSPPCGEYVFFPTTQSQANRSVFPKSGWNGWVSNHQFATGARSV